jgi:hypothetical protein
LVVPSTATHNLYDPTQLSLAVLALQQPQQPQQQQPSSSLTSLGRAVAASQNEPWRLAADRTDGATVTSSRRSDYGTTLSSSWRATLKALPFGLRLQLERALAAAAVSNDDDELATRKQLLVSVRILLPPLVAIPWRKVSLACIALFTQEIGTALAHVSHCVARGYVIPDWESAVTDAWLRAQERGAHMAASPEHEYTLGSCFPPQQHHGLLLFGSLYRC